MKRTLIAVVLALFVAGLAPRSSAQLLNKEAPVIVGHYHLNVTSVAEHKKFWVETLGGTAMKVGSEDVVKFPDIYLLLRVQKPTGPTRGTALDHIGFAVPDVPALTTKVVAAGYQLTTGREPAPGQTAAAAAGTAAPYGRFAYLLGPDGAKVELVTSAEKDAPPIKHHHVHFINKQYLEMCEWYKKAFDAPCGRSQTDFFQGGDLPGVGYSLNFFRWEGDQGITHAPTKGRVYDHVGFEVKNLEEFCRKLEAKGIALTTPYRKAPGMNNIGTATITDPWGVSIELTEGLRSIS